MAGATAYLVIKREDGFGDVFPLTPGQRYTLGRATTNTIVLKDEKCSREHAEVSHTGGRWRIRDLGSTNGTRINDRRVEGEWELNPHDELHVGHTSLLFVEDMNQLPDVPLGPTGEELSIKKRLGQTRFLTPLPPQESAPDVGETPSPQQRHALSRDLALLYRLALDMGSASSQDELV